MSQCVVCESTQSLHVHHVVPRAYGGERGPTVVLCSHHHSLVHKLAVRREMDANVPEAHRDILARLVANIVRSEEQHGTQLYKVIIPMDGALRATVSRLKQDLGKTSIVDTIIACIQKVAVDRGLKM